MLLGAYQGVIFFVLFRLAARHPQQQQGGYHKTYCLFKHKSTPILCSFVPFILLCGGGFVKLGGGGMHKETAAIKKVCLLVNPMRKKRKEEFPLSI